MNNYLEEIKNAVIDGRYKEIVSLVQRAIDSNLDINEIINNAMIAAMDVVGKKFADNEIFVPEMLVSATTMKMGMDIIKPLLKGEETESKGTIVICTVKGDIHDIGKNLVVMMLEGAGFKVVDLGVDITIENLIQKIEEIKPPDWAKFVKTGVHRKYPPQQEDWWYTRASSILMKIYLNGPVGVQRLRTYYGGKKERASPSNIQTCMAKFFWTRSGHLFLGGMSPKDTHSQGMEGKWYSHWDIAKKLKRKS